MLFWYLFFAFQIADDEKTNVNIIYGSSSVSVISHWLLHVIGCIMSDSCQAELSWPCETGKFIWIRTFDWLPYYLEKISCNIKALSHFKNGHDVSSCFYMHNSIFEWAYSTSMHIFPQNVKRQRVRPVTQEGPAYVSKLPPRGQISRRK